MGGGGTCRLRLGNPKGWDRCAHTCAQEEEARVPCYLAENISDPLARGAQNILAPGSAAWVPCREHRDPGPLVLLVLICAFRPHKPRRSGLWE